MYSIWNFFIERRAFTLLGLGALLVSGVFAIVMLPKESTPEIKIPTAIVSTVLPGATAADVERLVTDTLEPTIRNVADVDTVTSVSRESMSRITVMFRQSVDIDVSVQDLRNAVERVKVNLPSDAKSPVVTKLDFSNQPILQVGVGSDLAPEALTQLADELKDDLVNISGVYKVETSGVRPREISVVAHPKLLTTYGVTLGQITSALSSADASAPAGGITIDGVDYPLQFKGSLTSADTVRHVPVTGTVSVEDVATVIDGYGEAYSISRLKSNEYETQYALSLSIYKADGVSILDVADRVTDRLAELKNTMLAGSNVAITYNAADDVRTSIHDLMQSGAFTILLVVAALFVGIGGREAFVAALAIPFSFMVAFIGLLLVGETINFISLFALIIAIGVLVDSAIVMVEGVHTGRLRGLSGVAAAKQSVKEYAWPLIAGTMTTVGVFVPLLFLSGIMGEFIKHIPETIIIVLLASIVVTLGYIPIISTLVVRTGHSRFADAREQLWKKIGVWYRVTMEKLFMSRRLQRSLFMFLAVSCVGGIALVATGGVALSMFPESDMDLFYVEIEMPQATTLTETDALTQRVEKVVSENVPYLESFLTTVGATSLYSSSGSSASSKYANITVNLIAEADGRDRMSTDITNTLRMALNTEEWGAADISVYDIADGPPTGAPVVVQVWSNDAVSLAEGVDIVERVVEENGDTRDVSSSLANDGTELTLTVDRDKAEAYGLSARTIAYTLQTAIAGVSPVTIRVGGDDIDVRVKLALNDNFVNPEDTTVTSADAIATIPIRTSRGTVPLGTFITMTANRSASLITHEDGKRIGTVSAYLMDGANAVEVTDSIRKVVSEYNLPENVRVTYGGDNEDIVKMFSEMLIALGAGLACMFAILVLEFNAFRTSLRLLSVIPLALAGVLWGLFFTGQPLSFTAFLGIIALAGILINHGILLLADLNQRKVTVHSGVDIRTIILDSSASRVRPVLLTTATTVLGMMPLVTVSAMWAPLALTVASGLVYGTVLTLVFIPLISYRYEKKHIR